MEDNVIIWLSFAWRRILVKQSTTWLGGKIKEEKPQTQSIQRLFCIGKALPKLPIVGIETFLSLIVLAEAVFKKCVKGYYIERSTMMSPI